MTPHVIIHIIFLCLVPLKMDNEWLDGTSLISATTTTTAAASSSKTSMTKQHHGTAPYCALLSHVLESFKQRLKKNENVCVFLLYFGNKQPNNQMVYVESLRSSLCFRMYSKKKNNNLTKHSKFIIVPRKRLYTYIWIILLYFHLESAFERGEKILCNCMLMAI